MALSDPLRHERSGSAVFMAFRNVLEIGALLSTIAVCAGMLYMIVHGIPIASGPRSARSGSRPSADTIIPVTPAPIDGAQLEGDRHAKVAVIEYSDFQCPFCGRFARDTFPQVEKEYIRPGKVLFAFRQFPLESIHANALRAAEAAECGADQGHFWELHTLLFAEQQQLDDANLRERATRAGLAVDRFDSCMQGDVATRVRADAQTGKRLFVEGTPTFFFGTIQPNGTVKITKRLSGAVPFDQFKAAIEFVANVPPGVARRN